MSETKGFFGEYKIIDENHDSENKKYDDPIWRNDRAVQMALEEDYAIAIEFFDKAISLSEGNSNVQNHIETIYHNSGIAKIESGLFDFALSFGFDIRSRSFKEFLETINKLNKLTEFLKLFV